jgi:hypothetical protein
MKKTITRRSSSRDPPFGFAAATEQVGLRFAAAARNAWASKGKLTQLVRNSDLSERLRGEEAEIFEHASLVARASSSKRLGSRYVVGPHRYLGESEESGIARSQA